MRGRFRGRKFDWGWRKAIGVGWYRRRGVLLAVAFVALIQPQAVSYLRLKKVTRRLGSPPCGEV